MQTLGVVVLVAAAAAYVGYRMWAAVAKARRARSAPGCGTDGCCK